PNQSDDDAANMTSPRKAALFSGPGAALAGGGMLAGGGLDFGNGAPSNLGKVNSAAGTPLADTDPLGVPTDISFDSVGGLGSHIQQLKEMVSLPLLYPEVFERFKITPPRGVLFHGPPGTGKTLLARALAASCSTEGRKISFFMRKGADCLSKWVGEAERQLRLLFDEARACQPSIIFFDEIDGLAPVRSSKQEQIHASIVSTLLALMDGMDGRGQVIVIGATNRPDAIDPALRRPGRFDREFYFPLPNVDARRKIIDIHTTGWNPPLEDTFKDELAKLTKGYGGADLRALCTEAALNAVQRTYPQIYKTNDRLLIKPEEISVTARDFVISQQNLIPSTARSTSSAAAPLPPQLVPLLSHALDNAKTALAKVLPPVKRVNVLEEAEFVEVDGGFEKEKMLQSFEQLRVFRPRLIVCGEPGMGQSYVGAAVLHHLEGFHVQTLDLATLVSDSTRTMEASCVQLFIEAKRHKPSILFIPSLVTWCASVGETVRSTIKGLLDGLDPSDPILLLAVVDGHFSDVPADVRSWFGFVKGNRVIIRKPTSDDRRAFFEDVFAGISRPPNEYPDGMPRRKRRLEKLPIAPPPPPRAPTAAEIQAQQQHDLRLLEYLKWRLGPVLSELKKRYKRFQRSLYKDWQSDDLEWRQEQLRQGETVTGLGTQPYHNVDLDTMASDLYKGYYYTPDDFLQDILRIQANAEVNKIMENDAEAPIRAGQMVNHVKVMLDQTFDAASRAECEKMAERMREKDKAAPRKDPFKPRLSRGGKEGEEAGSGDDDRGAAAEEDEQAEAESSAQAERGCGTKRDRAGSAADAEGEHDDGDDHHGAGSPKKQRMDVDGPADLHPQPAAVELSNGQAVASTGSAAPFASALASQAQPSFASILNPTSSVAGVAVVAPMAVASASIDAPSSALSGPAPEPEPERSPTPMEATPPPPRPFVVPSDAVDALRTFLVSGTDDLTVDQLEQLRAACFDIVWRGRSEWDRSAVIGELDELAHDFVDEVKSLAA
ncbi:AAA-domain-containing protein, partial [Rhodotorula sp. JG-1b]